MQVVDYTVSSVYSQLIAKAKTLKFDAILECYGDPSSALYSNSKSYLYPHGVYVSVGPQPNSAKDFFLVLKCVYDGFILPAWLGGVKAEFKYVKYRSIFQAVLSY